MTSDLKESQQKGDRRRRQRLGRNGDLTYDEEESTEVCVWGGGRHGQLGLSRRQDRKVPTRNVLLRKLNIVKVAAGESFSVFLSGAGRVYQTGDLCEEVYFGSHGRTEPRLVEGLDPDDFVKDIAAGKTAAYAITDDSRIYSWGMLAHSQLGYDLEDTLFIDMKREQSSYLRSVPRRRTAILSIQEHLLAKLSPNLPVGTAIEEEEEEEAMQLATRKEVQAVFALPKEVVALREKNVTKISAGHGFALALTQSGTIFGWGKNDQGQLGQGPASPMVVKVPTILQAFREAVDISAGASHGLAISGLAAANDKDAKQAVFSWGLGTTGALGHGSIESSYHPRCIATLKNENATLVEAGNDRSFVVTELLGKATLWAFGKNDFGELGIDRWGAVAEPTPVHTIDGGRIIRVKCGLNHTIALTAAHELFSWGVSEEGATGQNESRSRMAPWSLVLPHHIMPMDIECGSNHTLAVGRGIARTFKVVAT